MVYNLGRGYLKQILLTNQPRLEWSRDHSISIKVMCNLHKQIFSGVFETEGKQGGLRGNKKWGRRLKEVLLLRIAEKQVSATEGYEVKRGFVFIRWEIMQHVCWWEWINVEGEIDSEREKMYCWIKSMRKGWLKSTNEKAGMPSDFNREKADSRGMRVSRLWILLGRREVCCYFLHEAWSKVTNLG